ncbi:MAG: PLDc N-terminal domain-containing protein [Microthrixaceae bacterium]
MSKKRTWAELSTGAKVAVIAGGLAEAVVTGAAVRDLRQRERASLRGPKWLWFMASAVQPFGPLAYFAFARRKQV